MNHKHTTEWERLNGGEALPSLQLQRAGAEWATRAGHGPSIGPLLSNDTLEPPLSRQRQPENASHYKRTARSRHARKLRVVRQSHARWQTSTHDREQARNHALGTASRVNSG